MLQTCKDTLLTHFEGEYAHRLSDHVSFAWRDYLQTLPSENPLPSLEKLFATTEQAHLLCGLEYLKDFSSYASQLSSTPDTLVIVLESDFELLNSYCLDATSQVFLEHPQCHLVYLPLDEALEEAELPRKLAWFLMGLSYTLQPPLPTKNLPYQELKEALDSYGALVSTAWQSTINFGAEFYHNYYLNLDFLPEAIDGNASFFSFQNVPAVICGSGKSLDDTLPALQTLSSSALVIAAGSALTALSKSGIHSSLHCALDPTVLQTEHLLEQRDFETALYYRQRLHYLTLQKHHGPRCFVTGSGRYRLSEWFEEELGLRDAMDIPEGVSSTTFALSLAYILGCNPILFAGVDLSFVDDQSHTCVMDHAESLLKPMLVHRQGKNWKTRADWLAESQWIETFIAEHPERNYYTLSPHTLPIKKLPLLEPSALSSLPQRDLQGRFFTEQQRCKIRSVTPSQIQASLLKLRTSLDHCQEALESVLEALQRGQTRPQVFEDLAKEPAFRFILEPLADYYSRSLFRKTLSVKRQERQKGPGAVAHLWIGIEIEKIIYMQEALKIQTFMIQKAIENK